MPTPDTNFDENFKDTVGHDATSDFEIGGNYAGSNPTEHASSENLNVAPKDDDEDDLVDDDEADDDDLDEDDEDDDEDDEDDLDEDDEDADDVEDEDDEDDDEDEDDEDDDDVEDDEDDDDDPDATLKMDPSESIRGRATDTARAAVKRRS